MQTERLEELVEISGGWTTSAAAQGDLHLLRTTDISTGGIDWDSVPFCTSSPSNDQLILRDGDIVVARTGVGSVGNVALVKDPPRAVAASYLLRLRPRPGLDSEYLLWFLRSSRGKAELANRAVGSVMPNLSAKRLSSIPVPYPGIDRQRLIASDIVRAASHHDRALSSLRRASQSLNAAKNSLWQISLHRLSLANEQHPSRPLSEIGEVRDGARIAMNAAERAALRGDTPYYGASGVIDHVDGHTHEGHFLLVSEDGQNLESRKSDIALVTNGRFWANNHIHVLKMSDEVLPEYVAAYLNATKLDDFLTGTTQPKLPLNRLKSIPVPTPPIQTQRQVVDLIEGMRKSLENWARSIDKTCSVLSETLQNKLDEFYGVAESAAPSRGRATNIGPEEAIRIVNNEYESIEAALESATAGLTPAQLYTCVRLDVSDEDERVDLFYDMLRNLITAGLVVERRDGTAVRLLRS